MSDVEGNADAMSSVQKTMAAIEGIVRILGPLESEERQRVIQGVLVILGETFVGQKANTGQPLEEEQHASEISVPARARAWVRQNKLSDDQLSHVFDISDGAVTVIASEISGKNTAEKVIKTYVLAGIANLLSSGEPSFDDKIARSLCETLGCFDKTNHSKYVKEKGNYFVGGKGGWKLTAPGLKFEAPLSMSSLAQAMLSDEDLVLALRQLARSGQRTPVLLLLSQVDQPASTVEVRKKGVHVGFRAVEKWNLADILGRAANDGQVTKLASGWKLLAPGLKAIEAYYRPEAAIIREIRHSLRTHLARIANDQRRTFLEEAIRSFDVKAYRAAVVLSWVGAAHIIQDFIVSGHLTAFNGAGAARLARAASSGGRYSFVPVRSAKDFGVIGEADMLQLCQDAGIFHKAEKQILQDRLDLRNQCGHPNPIVIAEHAVASHIEILMLNVYSRY